MTGKVRESSHSHHSHHCHHSHRNNHPPHHTAAHGYWWLPHWALLGGTERQVGLAGGTPGQVAGNLYLVVLLVAGTLYLVVLLVAGTL